VRYFYFLRFFALGLLIFSPFFASAQAQEDRVLRGSIPEELLRPVRNEAPRYPIDIVIGEMGQGNVSPAAFNFANSLCEGFFSGLAEHRAIASVNSSLRENLISMIDTVKPLSYRIGGGREEADGAFSFLVRFIGRDLGITGELYIRHITRQVEREDGEMSSVSSWAFDDLLLEEAKSRDVELQESIYRYDFYPYERFY